MSKHCEHCTDSCDLYFDVSERLHTSGNAAWASGHCPYCNADMGKFIPHGERDLKFLREGHRRGRRDEREAVVAWLGQSGMFLSGVADAIERGEHIDGLREGGGATRSSLGNRPPHLYDDDLLGLGDNCYESADDIERGEHLIGGPVIDPLRGAVATGFSIGIEGDDE